MLNKHILGSVLQLLHIKLDIDMFAPHTNFQLKPYVSYRPDPEAYANNALHWGVYNNIYTYTPFSLISYVPKKIEEDEATVLLIAPNWPTQFWFPKMTSLLIHRPVILP